MITLVLIIGLATAAVCVGLWRIERAIRDAHKDLLQINTALDRHLDFIGQAIILLNTDDASDSGEPV